MRVAFMGTPEFAVPTLEALARDYNVIAVYTQPDRPAGRGRKLTLPPAKLAAERLGLPVHQPTSLRPAEEVEKLARLDPDVIVVAAFGQLLRQNVIDIPRHGILNVHASLLPRWRGASPVTAAILAGDNVTGVTIMQIDAGLDTGPMVSRTVVPIEADDTTGSLTDTLANAGARLLAEILPGWVEGRIEAIPQDNSLSTFAPRVKPEHGIIDWSRPAAEIDLLVRAMQPRPGAVTSYLGKPLKVISGSPGEYLKPPPESRPGTVFAAGRNGLAVATGDGSYVLKAVQPHAGKVMDAASFRAGQRQAVGAILSSQ